MHKMNTAIDPEMSQELKELVKTVVRARYLGVCPLSSIAKRSPSMELEKTLQPYYKKAGVL
jgi:hypothetical protein